MSEHKLVMPFIDQSNSFTHGFECGQIWEKIQEAQKIENHLCHVKNREQIIEMAKTFGCNAVFETLDDTWLEVTIKPKEF